MRRVGKYFRLEIDRITEAAENRQQELFKIGFLVEMRIRLQVDRHPTTEGHMRPARDAFD